MTAAPWLLAMDTSTNTVVVAAGTAAGELLDAETFEGRHRHSQELLPAIARLVERTGLSLANVAGIVVGTGPGAFTGLRVGLATAKTLAHETGRPTVGIPSGEALLAGVDEPATLWLPSGPRDRVAVAGGMDPVVIGADGGAPEGWPSTNVAVDLDGRAPEDAVAAGRRALASLPRSLLRLGAARFAEGDFDDAERLVPRYASAPRGATSAQADGGVAWSRDPR